jgi:cysteine desulfurase/selenocysteine lyase
MENEILTRSEVDQLRAETKGTLNRIHFNNAGASMPPDVVVNTVVNYLQEEALEGGYETEFRYNDQIENTYNLIAKLINANPYEIAVVENASMAWGLAINGIDFKNGDEIITSEVEYVTNLISFLNVQKSHQVSVKVVPNDEHGNFMLDEFKQAITQKTKLIAVTHIPSAAGCMLPIIEIGKIAREHNILYLVDACQSVGQVPIDVEEIGCDMLSVTGRKYLRAPRGTGFLYVRQEVQNYLKLLFIDGFTADLISPDEYKIRNDARRFELYEKNRALTIGLGKAVEYALNIGIDRIWQRIQYLAGSLRQQLTSIKNVIVHDMGDHQCGIVTFSIANTDAVSVKNELFLKGINVSVGQPKSTLIYMNKNHLNGVVRASVHYYNTEVEISIMVDLLKEMAT